MQRMRKIIHVHVTQVDFDFNVYSGNVFNELRDSSNEEIEVDEEIEEDEVDGVKIQRIQSKRINKKQLKGY
jgi:hypothetical protein